MADDRGINPYAPPVHDGEPFVYPVEVPAAGALFSPKQIGVATVFGSVFGGSLLLQANYRALGEPRAANVTIAVGLLFTGALYVTAFKVGMPLTSLVIHLAAIVIFCVATSQLQGDRYEVHVLTGGPRRSSWWVLGAFVAWGTLRLGISFVARLLAQTSLLIGPA